ncbi:2-amino-4-hydroxy-6-hydroxymethyldihydropteridine diphosphokinase [Oceanicella sp. SM1341]|uniref:2-amino-4-hydroxy-6- hydroxymethyldihydropteridine diphosphokinase n=1 Tax=Oceanicella sp. SM1341 TaxID=1548889 RepID=UPI000E4DAF43|nr:2-amino-4-hydroxy-6-hydroxymethyldihydropteridine diphosphokinase [Oceanicella sp. SM1341]
MNLIYVAVGSNRRPDAAGAADPLSAALTAIIHESIRPRIVSPWYRSPAWPAGIGPDFVNGAFLAETQLGPEETLAALQRVENALGRVRETRWGPRVIDLDLLAWNDIVTPDRAEVERLMALGLEAGNLPAPEHLVLPHPRMHERGFVLAPLLHVAPDWVHPLTGLSVREMHARLPEAALEGVIELQG